MAARAKRPTFRSESCRTARSHNDENFLSGYDRDGVGPRETATSAAKCTKVVSCSSATAAAHDHRADLCDASRDGPQVLSRLIEYRFILCVDRWEFTEELTGNHRLAISACFKLGSYWLANNAL